MNLPIPQIKRHKVYEEYEDEEIENIHIKQRKRENPTQYVSGNHGKFASGIDHWLALLVQQIRTTALQR